MERPHGSGQSGRKTKFSYCAIAKGTSSEETEPRKFRDSSFDDETEIRTRTGRRYGLLRGGSGKIGLFARGRKSIGVSLCRQTKSDASGTELLVASQACIARVGKAAALDLGDLGAALLAEPALGA
jgi:hypothetical protein